MNTNVKLGLMALASAVVANKVLAAPFAGLAPVQQRPAVAYGGTVLALCGVGAVVMKKQPKAAVLLAGAAAGLAVAGYQSGAYTTGNIQPAQGSVSAPKALPSGAQNKIGVAAPGGGFGNAGPNGTVTFDKNPVPTSAGGEGGLQGANLGQIGGTSGADLAQQLQDHLDALALQQQVESQSSWPDIPNPFSDQAGLAVRNQAGRASSRHYG